MNDTFSIIVKYKKGGISLNMIPVFLKTDSGFFSKYDVIDGRSYMSMDGRSWSDLKNGSERYYASIRAYTDDVDIVQKKN